MLYAMLEASYPASCYRVYFTKNAANTKDSTPTLTNNHHHQQNLKNPETTTTNIINNLNQISVTQTPQPQLTYTYTPTPKTTTKPKKERKEEETTKTEKSKRGYFFFRRCNLRSGRLVRILEFLCLDLGSGGFKMEG
jgi:hypothetical protein